MFPAVIFSTLIPSRIPRVLESQPDLLGKQRARHEICASFITRNTQRAPEAESPRSHLHPWHLRGWEGATIHSCFPLVVLRPRNVDFCTCHMPTDSWNTHVELNGAAREAGAAPMRHLKPGVRSCAGFWCCRQELALSIPLLPSRRDKEEEDVAQRHWDFTNAAVQRGTRRSSQRAPVIEETEAQRTPRVAR